jgi:hypothetical protein
MNDSKDDSGDGPSESKDADNGKEDDSDSESDKESESGSQSSKYSPSNKPGKPTHKKYKFGFGTGSQDPRFQKIKDMLKRSRHGGYEFELPDDLKDEFKNPDFENVVVSKMYDFYESIAEQLTIIPPKDGNDESCQIPIAHMQKKRMSRLGESSIDDIDWEATQYHPNGDWSFFSKQCPVMADDNNPNQYGSTKDICFIGDVSGSMGFLGPILGTGEKINPGALAGHDCFSVMVHSIIKDLKQKEMAYHLRYSSILFSDVTEFSGWHPYYELDDLFKFMYTGYQGGGTAFDARVLKNMYNTSSDKFLTIMLTDGAISNAEEASKVVNDIMKAGNDFVLIEYLPGYVGKGASSDFGNFVRKSGGEVYTIGDFKDLFTITLNKTRGMY